MDERSAHCHNFVLTIQLTTGDADVQYHRKSCECGERGNVVISLISNQGRLDRLSSWSGRVNPLLNTPHNTGQSVNTEPPRNKAFADFD